MRNDRWTEGDEFPRGLCPECNLQRGWKASHVLSFENADALARHLREAWGDDPAPDKGYPIRDVIGGVVRWYSQQRAFLHQDRLAGREPLRIDDPDPGSWEWRMTELQQIGLCTPGNVEKLAEEHFGDVPEYLAVVLRMWRRALAIEMPEPVTDTRFG